MVLDISGQRWPLASWRVDSSDDRLDAACMGRKMCGIEKKGSTRASHPVPPGVVGRGCFCISLAHFNLDIT